MVGARAAKKARQGVRYHALEDLTVLDPDTMQPVPADGETMGEVMFRGNVVMKGYLKNPKATQDAFKGGWFHSGDLGVLHADGYIQLKDRSKDIIISGGENISSIEVEDCLYKHPAIQAAAVVAKPDEKWGETPCAFVELKPGKEAAAEDIIKWCRKAWPPTRCQGTWCSSNCRKRQPARSRSSSCGRRRRGCKIFIPTHLVIADMARNNSSSNSPWPGSDPATRLSTGVQAEQLDRRVEPADGERIKIVP